MNEFIPSRETGPLLFLSPIGNSKDTYERMALSKYILSVRYTRHAVGKSDARGMIDIRDVPVSLCHSNTDKRTEKTTSEGYMMRHSAEHG